ncbi:hypothetical protein C8R47DRAFT_1209525 [Mycena vitilis]|nr:hypothetical protein C8R47DRAFT_1209525 [Mycena vitilis]
MPPRGAKSPAKPRPKPKPLKSPKKKPISSAFIDDEAEDSDDGVLVDRSDTVDDAPASDPVPNGELGDEDLVSDNRYEDDFINDGDPYEDLETETLGYPSPSPPPSPKKTPIKASAPSANSLANVSPGSPSKRLHRRGATPDLGATAKKLVSSSADVIELASSSDEDLEAMDVDDTMFKKPTGVKPSALPPSLLTRSAAVKLGVKVDAESLDGAVESKPSPRARKPLSAPAGTSMSKSSVLGAIDPSELDEETAKRLEDLVNAFMKENKAKRTVTTPSAAKVAAVRAKPSPRVDHDKLALEAALRSSINSDPETPPPSTKIRELSPNWDPPFAGDVFNDGLRTPVNLYSAKSSLSKSKGKARYVSPDRMYRSDEDDPHTRPVSVSSKKSVLLPAAGTVLKSKPLGKSSSAIKRKQPESSDAEIGEPATVPRQPISTPEKRHKAGFEPAASVADLNSYLVKKRRPEAVASGGEPGDGPPLTMAQFMRASKGEAAETEDAVDNQYPGGGDESNTVFLEDLESYKAYFNPNAPCGVFDLDLQDESLRSHYVGLPPLPSGRRVVAAYDKNRNSHDDIDFSTGGHVRFSSWYAQNPHMLAANSMGAMLFERAEPNFVNLSRVSPLDLGSRVSGGSASTHRLYIGDRLAICVSAVCCTESHVVVPKRIGAKSDRERKWIEGVLHDQDYERWESCISLCFHANILYAQIRDKAVQFQTMISPDIRNEPSSSSQSFANVPASMFSTGSPKKSSPSKSRPAGATKTLLAYNDPIPVYDARKTVINFSADLDRLDQVLPLFPGEIPSGSFTIVGYTMASYMASLSGGAERLPHVGCNILWAIVCGTPGMRRVASASTSKA